MLYWLSLAALAFAAALGGFVVACLLSVTRLSKAWGEVAHWKREAKKQECLAVFWRAEAERREVAHA